jgi:hypothetical protein
MAVRGVATDDGTLRSVRVNGREARALAQNLLEWEAILEGVHHSPFTLTALAEDAAGNVERLPHRVTVTLP